MTGLRTVTRRDLLRLLAWSTGATLLGGCATRQSGAERKAATAEAAAAKGTPAGQGKVKITIGVPPMGNDLTLWRAITDSLATLKEWPANVELVHASIGGLGAYAETLEATLANGAGPDLFLQYEQTLYDAQRAGYLMVLDELASSGAKLDLKDFYDRQLTPARYNDRLFALPCYAAVPLVFINRDLVRANGLAMPPADWRWDTYRTMAQSMTRAGDTWGCGLPLDLAYLVERVWQNDGAVFDANRTRCLLDQPPAVEALQYWLDMAIKDQVTPGRQAMAGNALLFATGKLGMFEGTPDDASQGRFDGIKVDWATAGVPYRKTRVNSAVTTYVGMNAQCKHVREAWQALSTVMSANGLKTVAGLAHQAVARKSVNKQKPFANAQLPINWDIVLQGLDTGRGLDPVPNGAAVYSTLRNLPYRFFQGEPDVSAIMAGVVSEVNALLKGR